MISKNKFFGNSWALSLTADYQIPGLLYRVLVLLPDANGYKVKLPDPTEYKKGGIYFFIVNFSDTYSFFLTDHDENTIARISANECAEVCLRDPLTATWHAKKRTSDLPLGDSSIIMMGGIAYQYATYRYSVENDSWAARTSNPNPHNSAQSFSPNNNEAYIVGQVVSPDPSETDMYTPGDDAYTVKADCTHLVYRGTGCSLGANGYIFGGSGPIDECSKYDPITDTWSALSDMPSTERFLSAAGRRDKAWLTYGDGLLNEHYEFDPTGSDTASTFLSKTALPDPKRQDHRSCIIGNLYHTMGGDDGALNVKDDVDEYDDSLDSWVGKTALFDTGSGGDGRSYGAAISGEDGKGYYVGGVGDFPPATKSDLGEFDDNTWTMKTACTIANQNFCAEKGR